jgi:hypothetical protein
MLEVLCREIQNSKKLGLGAVMTFKAKLFGYR